jgi:hypothetical protein
VTEWSPVFLGIIAGAVLVMAVIQVGAIIAAARLAQRVNRLAAQVERDMAPLVANLSAPRPRVRLRSPPRRWNAPIVCLPRSARASKRRRLWYNRRSWLPPGRGSP